MKALLRKIFLLPERNIAIDVFLLISRVLIGYAMMMHGKGKIADPYHWMGEDSSFPAFFQFLGAVSEYVGGIALMFGLLSRVAAFGIACTMIVAVWMHAVELGDPFVSTGSGGSYEMAALFFLHSCSFLLLGAGRFSLDNLLAKFLLNKSDLHA